MDGDLVCIVHMNTLILNSFHIGNLFANVIYTNFKFNWGLELKNSHLATFRPCYLLIAL